MATNSKVPGSVLPTKPDVVFVNENGEELNLTDGVTVTLHTIADTDEMHSGTFTVGATVQLKPRSISERKAYAEKMVRTFKRMTGVGRTVVNEETLRQSLETAQLQTDSMDDRVARALREASIETGFFSGGNAGAAK